MGNASSELHERKGEPEGREGGMEKLGQKHSGKRQEEKHQECVQRGKKIRQRGREINNPTSRFPACY